LLPLPIIAADWRCAATLIFAYYIFDADTACRCRRAALRHDAPPPARPQTMLRQRHAA
jgi:hypothetical protein